MKKKILWVLAILLCFSIPAESIPVFDNVLQFGGKVTVNEHETSFDTVLTFGGKATVNEHGTSFDTVLTFGGKNGIITWDNENASDWWYFSIESGNVPQISNEYPANGSTSVIVPVTLNITVYDQDGDPMTINWYSNSSGSWEIFNITTGAYNGVHHATNSNFSAPSTKYWWRVYVSDGTNYNQSEIFHFTTGDLISPTVQTNQTTGTTNVNTTLLGYLESDGGDTCTVRFEWGEYGTLGNETTNDTATGGTVFSYNLSNLIPGILYMYRAYAENSYGSDYGENETFLTKPNVTYNFQVSNEYAPTILNITWSKGTGANTTYIERNTSENWSRGSGTVVYNGTGTMYNDTGLTQGTTYYYRAWSYTEWTYNPTVHQFSQTSATSSNLSLAVEPPFDGESTYYTDINALNLTWQRGDYSDREIVVMKNGSYPTSPSDGWVRQNSTNTWYNESNKFSGGYYTIWSYNETANVYSLTGLNIDWGVLGINVFNESTGAPIGFNIQITDNTGNNTYTAYDCTNTLFIDFNNIPYGEQTIIRLWNSSYRERVYYEDLYINHFYNNSYFLPAIWIPPGGDPGGGGGSNPNVSFNPELYFIRVIDEYNKPVEDAKVEFKRYINTTNAFENMSILYTDANGYVNLYLIPNVLYKVFISKEGYETEISDYIPPPPDEFGQTAEKVFKLTLVQTSYATQETLWDGIEWSIEPTTFYFDSSFKVYFNISSTDDKIEWFSASLYFYNTTNLSWDLLFTQNISTSPGGGSISFTVPNVTGKYNFVCTFKKQNFSAYTFGAEDGCRTYFITAQIIQEMVEGIPGDIYLIITIFIMIAAMALLVKFGAGALSGIVGLGIMGGMFALRPDLTFGAAGHEVSVWLVFLTTAIIYVVIMFLLRGRL